MYTRICPCYQYEKCLYVYLLPFNDSKCLYWWIGKSEYTYIRWQFNDNDVFRSMNFCNEVVRRFDRTSVSTIDFDDFIQVCVMLKTLTDKFREKDGNQNGRIQLRYEEVCLSNYFTRAVSCSLSRGSWVRYLPSALFLHVDYSMSICCSYPTKDKISKWYNLHTSDPQQNCYLSFTFNIIKSAL